VFSRAELTDAALSPALMTYLSPLLVSSNEIPTEVQPSRVRLLSIPEYFFNYKSATTDLAPFLGGCISAKVRQAFDIAWKAQRLMKFRLY
jgi:hypothetical protein